MAQTSSTQDSQDHPSSKWTKQASIIPAPSNAPPFLPNGNALRERGKAKVTSISRLCIDRRDKVECKVGRFWCLAGRFARLGLCGMRDEFGGGT
jgi:hypothetical protein